MANSGNLHLPDLTIKGFRGIDALSISRLGRVTLLAGKNSVGKTTVLDAVRAYAARGRASALVKILEGRDEVFEAIDEDGENYIAPDWPALFYGRKFTDNICLSIGPTGGKNTLKIKSTSLSSLSDEEASTLGWHSFDMFLDHTLQALIVEMNEAEHLIAWSIPERGGLENIPIRRHLTDARKNKLPPVISCTSLGPNSLSIPELAPFWLQAIRSAKDAQALQALHLTFGADVTRVTFAGNYRPSYTGIGASALVNLKNHDRPVPLRSLGDGAIRLFSVSLALVNSRGGFLLIDEAENGIHHSVQADYWRMVLQTAQENNVQVLATTHSWDCVRGFAQAATENEEVEGVLVRLEKDEDGLYTVEYSEERLQTAAEHDIEVR